MTHAIASLFDHPVRALAALATLDPSSRSALSGFELALELVASRGAHPALHEAAAELDAEALFEALDPHGFLGPVDDDDSQPTPTDERP